MNNKINLEELFGGLDTGAGPPPAPAMSRPLKPGDTDSVHIHLDDVESSRLASSAPDYPQEVVLPILSSHTAAFERLCHHFVESDARYTLDDGSLEIEDCCLDRRGHGTAWCSFTQSFYAGCRDQNGSDSCDCELTIDLNLRNRTMTVSTTVPDYERDPEEF